MIGFTKERIEQFIKNPLEHGLTRSEQMEMARQLLTSMEQEPVAFIDRANLDYLESGADADVWPASGAGSDDVLLYAAPQLPQPAVPDIATVETTYPDVQTNWQDAKMYAEGWNACRSAMLQGADRPQNEPQNIPENIPATQFKPVADLYGLTSPTGGETSFTFDAVEARDFIDGGWSCQEYVELERFQEAVSGNSPVIPDGWVMVPVEPTEDMIVNGFESEPDESFSDEKEWKAYDAMSGCQQAAHRAKLCWAAMIEAAPKLE